MVNLGKSKITGWNILSAVGIFLAGIIFTIYIVLITKNNAEERALKDFKVLCNDIKGKITTRLKEQSLLLRSGAALFNSTDSVTRSDWRNYISNLKLEKNLPGIQGVGVSLFINKTDTAMHCRHIRSEGFPEYKIKPSFEREIITSIIFLEPFSGRNLRAFGYDMFSDPTRRKAMEQSRDNNVASLSGKVTLVQETNEEPQAGALMYVPIYKKGFPASNPEERRKAILGWVYSPYRMDDLINSIIGFKEVSDYHKIHITIFDNETISTESLLFDNNKKDTLKNHSFLVYNDTIDFNEKKWILQFEQHDEDSSLSYNWMYITLILGSLISFLVFSLTMAFFRYRLRVREITSLNQQLKKLSIAVEQGPAAIVITDAKGKIEYANNKFFELTGYTVNEALGKSPSILKSGKTSKEEIERLWKTITAGKIWKGEFINLKKNGEEFIESAVISPIMNKENKIINYVAIKEDITRQKLAELSLIQSEKNLREANATKDKFFSIIAHDLKNPFQSIIGFSRLLLTNFKSYSPEKFEKYMQNVHLSATETYKLLENLLTWARSQTGRIDFNKEKVLLEDLIKDCVSIANINALHKNQKIIYESSLESICIYADRNMVDTVIRNLLSNAIKFTHQNGTIKIKAELIDSFIQITVEDNGIGMTSDAINKLFNITEKFSMPGTNDESGTGLGLILSKEFIERHGGKISVISEPDEGSKFIFTLPYCETND